MITLTTEQAQQIEEALKKTIAGCKAMGWTTVAQEQALAAIRAARAQEQEQEPVAFHRASFLSGYEAAQSDANACDVPPQGWICTRQAGHDGPCAAIEDNNGHELVSRAMSRLAEQDAAPVEPVKQEPVAWMLEGSNCVEFEYRDYHDGDEWTPLYAAPLRTKT